MPYHDFTEMPVWQKANEIVGDIYKLTEGLPKREDYALCSQIRDAAISIAANIAEGFRKRSKAEKLRYYYIAQGSLEEVKYYCLLSYDLEYCKTKLLFDLSEQLGKILDAYIRAINKNT